MSFFDVGIFLLEEGNYPLDELVFGLHHTEEQHDSGTYDPRHHGYERPHPEVVPEYISEQYRNIGNRKVEHKRDVTTYHALIDQPSEDGR